MALGVCMIGVLLPSALRPPAPQTPQTAQLSPDAPPDKNADSLIASLNRASSGTAGTDALGGLTPGGDNNPLDVAGPPPPKTEGCPHGFGNPPRQTESPYSAPCAPKFRGNNGGSTYKNVTGSEVKVGFWHVLGMPAERGPVPTVCNAGMSPQLRTFCVLQKYFNDRYEFNGRYVRLDAAKDDPADDPGARAAADNQATAGDFAVVHLSDSFCDELTTRWKLVCMDGTSTHVSVGESHAPYWWTYQMSHEENEEMYGEYACKKLLGRNADFAGGSQKGKPRKLGIIIQSAAVTGYRQAKGIAAQIKKQCGFDVPAAVQVDTRDDDNNVSLSTSVLKMIQGGVTTILAWGDTTGLWLPIMEAADANAYYPEWVALNSNGLDFNTAGKLEPPLQMAHLFGMSGWEMPRPFADTDCYKAYKAEDPANAPDQTACAVIYVSLELVMNGIQMAGPNLTPKTFEQGLFKIGYPKPHNFWEIGGGFGPGDRSWVDTMAENWWDSSAIDPQTGNPGGAYRYTNGGKRYGPGDMTKDLNVFHPGDPTGTQ